MSSNISEFISGLLAILVSVGFEVSDQHWITPEEEVGGFGGGLKGEWGKVGNLFFLKKWRVWRKVGGGRVCG